MGQTHRISSNNTTISRDGNYQTVQLHRTVIVKVSSKEIILDSGGWDTVTTKARMNQASNEWDLGFRVFQKSFQWFVSFKDQDLEFFDGMTLKR